MRKHGGTPSRRDKHVTLAAISPPGVALGRSVGGQQSGLAGCKPPPLFTRGASSCSSQGRRQGEPWRPSPRPSAPTYLPTYLIESLCINLHCLSAALLCYTGFQNHSLIGSTSCSCSTCCFGLGFQLQNLQDFIKISRALFKDIFLVAEAVPCDLLNRPCEELQHIKLNNKFIMSTPSVRTWPIRTVQVQMGSMAHPICEPPYRAPQHLSGASGSQGDPDRRRAEENKVLTTEALAAHGGDSLHHLHRRVAASVSRSASPASSSTAIGGPEEYEELRKKMDEYILHEGYYKSIRGEDGEEPLAVHISRPRTDLVSYTHSGPPSDRAETASLPRRPRPEYPRACCPTPRAPEVGPTRVEEQHRPRPTYGALDHTAVLLAKLLSGSEDPDVTALSEAIKAKLGIAEPLPKPELSSPSLGLSTLAEDLKRSRVSRLLPKVTCPSPFQPRARTVPMAELQDVPVTETEKRGLSARAPLAGVSPSGRTSGGGKTGRPIAQANIQLELPEFDAKSLPEWAEEFAEFLLLTGQSHVDVADKCSLLKRSCKKKFLQKQVKQIVKTCSTWAEVVQRLKKTFPVYETDLSVRTQIEELPMLPEFPSAARISEYVCDLEYLFSRMNVGS